MRRVIYDRSRCDLYYDKINFDLRSKSPEYILYELKYIKNDNN